MDLAIQVYIQASNGNSLQELLQGSSDPNELSSSIFLARVWRTTPAVKSALRLFKAATRCIDLKKGTLCILNKLLKNLKMLQKIRSSYIPYRNTCLLIIKINSLLLQNIVSNL